MSGDQFIEETDPEEVFSLVSNDTRVEILRALWEADHYEATFSELREEVGMRDSGQFNYHLDKLRGVFVTKTDDGYELTEAGRQINGSIAAGSYTVDARVDPIELDDPCPACGETQTFDYANEEVWITCDACEFGAHVPVPPSVIAGHDRESIPRVAERYFRTVIERITRGFCPYCDGHLDVTVDALASMASAEDDVPEYADALPWASYECQRCGAEPTLGLGTALLEHPAVVSFYHERGSDVREETIWEFAAWNTDWAAVRSVNPFRAAVTFEVDDDSITLVVDENLDVVEVET